MDQRIKNYRIKNSWRILLVVLLGIAAGCKSSDKKAEPATEKRDRSDKAALVLSAETVKLPIDTSVSARFFSFSAQAVNGNDYFAYSDLVSHSILIYDFKKGQLIKKIRFPKDGPNGMGEDQLFCWFKNFDSIFITSQYAIYMADTNGTVKRKYDLMNNSRKIGLQARFSGFMPFIINGTNAYFSVLPDLSPTNMAQMKDWPAAAKLDLVSGKISLDYFLPEQYSKGIYGGNFLYPYFCYNQQNGKFVFSFSADNNLYQTDLDTVNTSFSGNSKYISGEIKPAGKAATESSEERTRFSLFSDSYGPVYYDPYRNKYLRIAEQKLDDANFQAKKWSKKKSVIILDEHFNITGESDLDPNINVYSFFFTPGGVYVQYRDENDEDHVVLRKLDYSNK
jgi:hypothetical protein